MNDLSHLVLARVEIKNAIALLLQPNLCFIDNVAPSRPLQGYNRDSRGQLVSVVPLHFAQDTHSDDILLAFARVTAPTDPKAQASDVGRKLQLFTVISEVRSIMTTFCSFSICDPDALRRSFGKVITRATTRSTMRCRT